MLDMAGVDIPAEMDGKSILKLLDTDRPVNRWTFSSTTVLRILTFIRQLKNEI